MLKARLLGAVGIVALAVVVATALARAQDPAFEVVSIKPNPSLRMTSDTRVQPGGRYTSTNTPLEWIILGAWGLDEYQLVGAPVWVRGDHFDIVAKANEELAFPKRGETATTRLQLMLRAMLADRFALKAHMEVRDAPVYELVLARADGKLGPNFLKSETDCSPEAVARRGDPVFPSKGPILCGMSLGPDLYTAGHATIPQMVETLKGLAGRPVVDRTGLTGAFDLELHYSEDQKNTDLPSLYAALQEQLGLKLNTVRGHLDVLVIDHVEHPTED
jgi:uncharacterized protein (TIGR03435 family)